MPLDLRYAWRSLRRNPVTAATIILLLGIGIGFNTVIFSVVNALLLRPLPVQHPEELVELNELGALRSADFAWANCQKLVDHQPAALSQITCEKNLYVAVAAAGRLERRRVGVFSPNFFSFLGVNAMLGRLPEPSVNNDDQSAVLSYSFWQDWFHGDRNVLGSKLMVSGHPFVISAILPRGFNGIQPDTGPDIRITERGEATFAAADDFNPTTIVGRIRPDASLSTAASQVSAIWRQLAPPERQNIKDDPIEFVRIGTGSSLLRDQFGRSLVLLMYGVAGLLLIVCANVAGLLVAKAAARSRESAIRAAVGASRWQLIRQVLIESGLLIFTGGLVGVILTYAAMPLALRAMPPMRDRGAFLHPLRLEIAPDLGVLGFTLALCMLSALLFAVAPAIEAARADAHDSLKSARSSPRSMHSRSALVAIQVALCTMLLLGAGLLVRTLSTLQNLNPGFDARHIVTFSLDPRMTGHDVKTAGDIQNRLLEQVRALPGVQSAAYAGRGLMRGTGVKSTASPEGVLRPPGGYLNTSMNSASIDYFETMGMRLVAGRNFREADHADAMPTPVVVNQAFAQYFFPNLDPIGKRFGGDGKPNSQIIGVVTDAKYRSLREKPPPTFYLPFTLEARGGILHVRTAGDPAALIPVVQGILRSLDSSLPFYETHTLTEEIDASLWQDRLVAWLASMFAIMAAVLAGIGLYGMLAFNLAQRRREIGIRMSLGAEPHSIVTLISGQALLPVLVGLAAGLVGFAIMSRFLTSLLYGITVWDVPALALSMILLLITAGLAVAFPAWQATNLNPSSALREES